MIRIRQSLQPYEAFELEGSQTELSALRAAVLSFCDSPDLTSNLAVQTDVRPYPRPLTRLRFCKTGDRLLISVINGQLLISGKPEFLRLFAQSLPDGLSSAALARVPPQIAEARVHIVLRPE